MLRNHWYPLARSGDVKGELPVAVELFGEPLVLFRDGGGGVHCLEDRCAHRSAPLSLGVVREGCLECPYHGWRYGEGGRCVHIPTLEEQKHIPRGAHIQARAAIERGGLIWVWAGAAGTAAESRLAHYPALDSPEWWVAGQGVVDLDIDHGLLIENLLDSSHLPFTHRDTIARPEQAQPLVVELTELPNGGVQGVYKSTREPRLRLPDLLAFDPPCHVRAEKADQSLQRVWHCLPWGKDRLRMIWWIALRRAALDPATAEKLKDDVERARLEQMYFDGQSRIYQEDFAMLRGQQRRLALKASPFGCPVKVDALVLRYRRWREANEQPGTWFEGYTPTE
jgi:chlorophyllide a oxygenase